MAPQTMTSSQELLVQAAQKLSSAVTELGTAPNGFAKDLLELIEVSTKINQFDEIASAANAEATTEEAQKWREISLMTMQHARTHLVDQQQRLIDQLSGAAKNGASLYKDAIQSPEVQSGHTAVKLPPGLPSEVTPAPAVQPPPGLGSPPGLTCPTKPSKPASSPKLTALPNGLRPPPGLKSAGTAPGLASKGTGSAAVAPPPGFSSSKVQKPKTQKQAAGYPKIPQSPETNKPSFFEARFGTEAAPSVMNLDAYESD